MRGFVYFMGLFWFQRVHLIEKLLFLGYHLNRGIMDGLFLARHRPVQWKIYFHKF